MAIVRIDFTVPYELFPEGEWIIANCPPLRVASQGRTREEAKRNLEEALSLFLESCLERGTLAAVLKKAGLRPVGQAPAESAALDSTLSIPLILSAA